MIRTFFVLAIIVQLAVTARVQAQSPATALDRLDVDLWPDYDREAVLVLLTGTLPDSASPNATVTLPLSPEASINAVARVDSAGNMFDISYDESTPGELTLTTPDRQFRIEYYIPYTAEADRRSFTFDWQSDVAVNELVTSVQQPALASDLTLTPEDATVATRPDGLRYYTLSPQAVGPGQLYRLEARYTMTSPQLTQEILAAQEGGQVSPTLDESPETGFDWLLALAVASFVLLVAGVAWLLASNRRTKKRVVKPRPVRHTQERSTSPGIADSAAGFCHECGRSVAPGDRFCRYCGTAVKGAA